MPLVDYASSEEDEKSEEEEITPVTSKPVPETPKPESKDLESENVQKRPVVNSDKTAFTKLPQPGINPLLLMDDNSLSNLLLNKKTVPGKDQKTRGKVQISVPSVSDFSENDTAKKKPKLDVKGSGLFSILPPPKNIFESNKTLVPNSVANSSNKKYLNAKSSVINKYLKKSNSAENNDVDDDNDSAIGTSFFGSFLTDSGQPHEPETSGSNVTSGNQATQFPLNNTNVHVNETYQKLPPGVNEYMNNSTCSTSYNSSQYDDVLTPSHPELGPQLPETNKTEDNPLGLDEKAMQMLCGRKKGQQQIPMNIIDLSSEEVMPDSKEWLLKQLSQEKKVRSQSHRKSQGPSSQQRRKHQITYLAYQAKEQELELQNQWANNRMSRRQTQSKYGF